MSIFAVGVRWACRNASERRFRTRAQNPSAFSQPSGARSSATKIAADIDVSANRLSPLPTLDTILYSIHAALAQNTAKHIDPIINFIVFMRLLQLVI
jgi:hypothetical protein